MEILQIIVSIVMMISFTAMVWLVLSAWTKLNHLLKDIKDTKHTLAVTASLVMSMFVKSSIVELNDMKRTLRHLIEDEQFEEAEKLQDLIVKAEKNAMETIEKMNSAFGDIAEIHVMKLNQ